MNQPIAPSELILNPDGSVYHLNLRPEQLAETVILVGDQDRVAKVSKYFDKIEEQVQKREFVTHTGWLGPNRISVISTGIGTDNIDIVFNELDALVNIDLNIRTINTEKKVLDFIRIGTSGALSSAIPVDSQLVSVHGIGMDSLLAYYLFEPTETERQLAVGFHAFSTKHNLPHRSIAASADKDLVDHIGADMHKGITLSCPGFYGPQGRQLRLKSKVSPAFFDEIGNFQFEGLRVTNFEMETSAIFGMAKLLGHRAVSTNAIIANRITNEFSKNPAKTIDLLIQSVLEKL